MAGSRLRSESGRRARGFTNGDNAKLPPMKRWDGVSRTCRDWDKLRRDPEIWERNGNCLVHLYAKGDSKRGPSFKLPFSTLISNGCLPFIQRFLVPDDFHLRTTPEDIERWDQTHPRSTVELYIPIPPSSTDTQIFEYHLAIRNFLAWVLGRPMAGEFLGSALVTLRGSLREFRCFAHSADSAYSAGSEDGGGGGGDDDDFMEYVLRAGYLNMAEEPIYALALLHLAETFQMKELYSKAFAHCVGMYGLLARCPEFQLTTSGSRNLIKEARTRMNSELSQTSFMLRTFLDDDLSETYLGVPPGTRAHLERFRCFLLSFYSRKLGYYPPRAFDAPLLRVMAADFDALYRLLSDNSLTGKDTMPPTHAGGICTLQLVRAFDERHELSTQKHPLPQLPRIAVPSSARLLTWFTRGEKMTSSQRQITHLALVKSSNRTPDILKNDLVRAYRRFEEDAILAPNKADRNEKVSVLDARKVRWILIYAVHQVLRRVTRYPREVEDQKTSYHLNVPMGGVPPWQAKYVMLQQQQQQPAADWVIGGVVNPSGGGSSGGGSGRGESDGGGGDRRRGGGGDVGGSQSSGSGSSRVIEIKPDIDYLALNNKDRRSSSLSSVSESARSALSRSSSLSAQLRRGNNLRKSLQIFRSGSQDRKQQHKTKTPQALAYHEIIVQGYGNGTQAVTLEPEPEPEQLPVAVAVAVSKLNTLACRSDSTASTQSKLSSASTSVSASASSAVDDESMSSTVDTLPSGTTTPGLLSSPLAYDDVASEKEPTTQPTTPKRADSWRSAPEALLFSRSPRAQGEDSASEPRKRYSLRRKRWTVNFDNYVAPQERAEKAEKEKSENNKCGAGLQRRHTLMLDMRRKPNELLERLHVTAVRVRDGDLAQAESRPSDDWSAMQAFMDMDMDTPEPPVSRDEWAQYAGLGGLIDLRS